MMDWVSSTKGFRNIGSVYIPISLPSKAGRPDP